MEGQGPEVRMCSLLQCPEALVGQVEPVKELPRVGPVEEPGLLVVRAGPGWWGELWRNIWVVDGEAARRSSCAVCRGGVGVVGL